MWWKIAQVAAMIGDGLGQRIKSARPDRSCRFSFAGISALLSAFFLFPFLSLAASTDVSPPVGLTNFYQALDALEAGHSKKGLVILHLGDSHIAIDHMTGEMRQRWQALFGDAGRGLAPGVPYRYYGPQGYDITMSSGWSIASSLRGDVGGPFGISGFRAEATSRDARMELTSRQEIKTVEIEAYGGPDTGAILLKLGDAAALRLSTRLSTAGVIVLRVPAAKVHEVELAPAGDGQVTILGWTMLGSSDHPGVRYDSYGISGATLDIVSHWTPSIVDEEVKRLAPDLILLGYGTNEGFNDHMDAEVYVSRYAAFVKRLKTLAPHASIVVLGAFDAARRTQEGDRQLCETGWAIPPNIEKLRQKQRQIADKMGLRFIDGSLIMDGPCGISAWVHQVPPLAWPDHVHLRPEGARRAGAAIWNQIIQPYMSRMRRHR